ncbi:MAG: SpvB/TcaC N-terminal domain-containing protein [Stellaceae bacterium]
MYWWWGSTHRFGNYLWLANAEGLDRSARKIDKGPPRYCDDEESDVFILSGAEDLVPILDATGAPMCRAPSIACPIRSRSMYPSGEGRLA